jgi:hypothetical protein
MDYKYSMPKAKKAQIQPKAVRGYARHERDVKRLEASGLPTNHIYRADKGELPGKFKMRPGEFLGVVDGLLAFGPTRRPFSAAVALIHAQGATVLDVESGLNSREHGVEMANLALNPPQPSAEYLAQVAEERREAWRKKHRVMPKDQAFPIWRNPVLSLPEKLDLMRGWTKDMAYKAFGPTGRPAGRRHKKPKT